MNLNCALLHTDPDMIAKLQIFVGKIPFLTLCGSYTEPLTALKEYYVTKVEVYVVGIVSAAEGEISGMDFCRRLTRKLADAVLLTYAFNENSQSEVARLLSCDVPLIFLENHISCRGLAAIDSEPEYTGMLAPTVCCGTAIAESRWFSPETSIFVCIAKTTDSSAISSCTG